MTEQLVDRRVSGSKRSISADTGRIDIRRFHGRTGQINWLQGPGGLEEDPEIIPRKLNPTRPRDLGRNMNPGTEATVLRS